MSHYVYRTYDAVDRLLYVGCSQAVGSRMGQHSQHSAWYPFHVRVEVEEHASPSEALAAESHAITTEYPRWNIEGRSPNHPDGHCDSIKSAAWLRDEVRLWQQWLRLKHERSRALAVLRDLDHDLAVTNDVIDSVSNGRGVFGKDYDLDGPVSVTERKRRAVAGLRSA